MSSLSSSPALKEDNVVPASYPHAFLRCRTIAFCAVIFFSFLWVVTLCVVLYLQADVMCPAQKAILAVMLGIHVFTIFIILFLLIQHFKLWLDAARIFFLLVAHVGVAGTYAYWVPRFDCLGFAADSQTVCGLIILYILITSWIIPVLLLLYIGGFGFMLYQRRRRLQAGEDVGSLRSVDLEKSSIEKKRELHVSQQSSLFFPIQSVPVPPVAIPTAPTIPVAAPSPVSPVYALAYTLPGSKRSSIVPTPTSATSLPYAWHKRSSSVSTPTSGSFSLYSNNSPAEVTPTSTTFTNHQMATNIYAIPPLPHHWNSNPPPTARNRHLSTALTSTIIEEPGEYYYSDQYSAAQSKRTSARLSKGSRSSRLPSL